MSISFVRAGSLPALTTRVLGAGGDRVSVVFGFGKDDARPPVEGLRAH
ncbi:hypothetical protein [Nocardioides glacieisoli]|nr:hypothetical protein [Nocardioides glacieisoli]